MKKPSYLDTLKVEYFSQRANYFASKMETETNPTLKERYRLAHLYTDRTASIFAGAPKYPMDIRRYKGSGRQKLKEAALVDASLAEYAVAGAEQDEAEKQKQREINALVFEHTGPRGGQFYVTDKGRKVYVRQK